MTNRDLPDVLTGCNGVTFKLTVLNACTYKQFAFVKVLASPTGIFHFFTEHQGHFKKEEVPFSTLSN